MLTIKKQAAVQFLLLSVTAGLLLSGCKPAGQRDLLKGEALVKENRFADAVPKLKDATAELMKEPGAVQAQAYNLLGVAYQGSGDPKMAIEAYKNALKLDNSLLIAYYNLGALYLEQGNYGESIKALTAYTKVNPKDADAYVKMATAHLRASIPLTGNDKTVQLNGAKADLEWALHLAPTAEALNTMGMVELQKQGPNALQYFNESLKKNPSYAPAMLNIAIYYDSYLHDRKQALEKYKAYLAAAPNAGNAKDVQKVVQQMEAELNPQPAVAAVTQPAVAAVTQTPTPTPATVKTNPAPPVAATTQTPVVPANTIDVNAKALAEANKRENDRKIAEAAKAAHDAEVKKALDDAKRQHDIDLARDAATEKERQNAAIAKRQKEEQLRREADAKAKAQAEQDAANKLAREKAAREDANRLAAEKKAKDDAARLAANNAARTNTVSQPKPPATNQLTLIPPQATPVTTTNPPVKVTNKPSAIKLFFRNLFTDDTNDVQDIAQVEPPKPVKEKPPEKPKKVKVVEQPKVQPKEQAPAPAPVKTAKKTKTKEATKTVKATPIPDSSATNTDSYPPLIELPAKGPVAHYTYHNVQKPTPGNKSEGQRLTNAGIEAQRQEHLMEAIGDYQGAIQADPASFEAYFRLSLSAHEASDFPTALYAMENALAINPDSVDARYAFAWTLQRGRYFQDAANELEKLLTQKPDETRAHLLLANICAQQLDQPKMAKEHYTKVLEQDPNNAQAVAIRYWLAGNP